MARSDVSWSSRPVGAGPSVWMLSSAARRPRIRTTSSDVAKAETPPGKVKVDSPFDFDAAVAEARRQITDVHRDEPYAFAGRGTRYEGAPECSRLARRVAAVQLELQV